MCMLAKENKETSWQNEFAKRLYFQTKLLKTFSRLAMDKIAVFYF